MSIVSKRIGSARLFADELSVILGTVSVRSSVCEQFPACGNRENFENLGR